MQKMHSRLKAKYIDFRNVFRLNNNNPNINNEYLQQIRDSAEKKYKLQYEKILTGIDFLIDSKTDLNWSVMILHRVNEQLPSVLIKLYELFTLCKEKCNKEIPPNTPQRDQLNDLETKNKYAYAQTCKSLKIIKACIKFNSLCSLFESRLNRLFQKIISETSSTKNQTRKSISNLYPAKIQTRTNRSRLYSTQTRSSRLYRSRLFSAKPVFNKTRRQTSTSNKSITSETFDEFGELYRDFVSYIKSDFIVK